MQSALAELRTVAEGIDPLQVETACQMIADAGRIMLYGCGREGLQIQGFAMRLHHLGKLVSMQGDMAAPPMMQGDLFIVSAGPGALATVSALIGQAKAGGASVLFLTAQAQSQTAKIVDHTILVTAQTMANDQKKGASTLPMGSLYEGALFVLFEAMILKLIVDLDQTPGSIRARHTNME
jgi:6-phospho-3-hexuloisomerase